MLPEHGLAAGDDDLVVIRDAAGRADDVLELRAVHDADPTRARVCLMIAVRSAVVSKPAKGDDLRSQAASSEGSVSTTITSSGDRSRTCSHFRHSGKLRPPRASHSSSFLRARSISSGWA